MRRPTSSIPISPNPRLAGGEDNSSDTKPGSSSDNLVKLRRLELINELFQICNSTGNLNELMKLVFNKVVKDVGADAGSLWLINEKRTEITCHVADGPTKDKVINLKLPKGTGVVGYVIDNAKSETVFDTSKDSRFSASVDAKTGFVTHSMICAPLIVENTAIGAIQLLNKKTQDGKFNNDDLNLLQLLCQSCAMPIVNARLGASEKKVHELSVLLDISSEITSTLDLDGCLLTVVNLCSKLIDYDRAAIALVEKDTVKIRAISRQASVDLQDPDIINLNNLFIGVFKQKADVYIPSCKKYLKETQKEKPIEDYINRYHPGTIAIYRLFDKESELGLFFMESREENLIPAAMSDRISLLKNMLTVSLRNAQLYNSVPRFSLKGKFASAKKLYFKKAGIIAAGGAVLLLGLGIIRMTEKIPGKCEILPQKKNMLYARVDGMVERVSADPYKPIHKGDTLLQFNTDEFEKNLSKEMNRMVVLQQTMGTLVQQAKYADYHAKQLEYKQAQLEVFSLKRMISESTVQSPVNGRLVNDKIRNLPGQRFSKGSELFEVLDLEHLEMKVYLPEKKINNISTGQLCLVRVPAFPGKTFKGTVKQVVFDKKEEDKNIYFPVMVEINDSLPGILPGMSGRAKIVTQPRSLLKILMEKPLSYLIYKFWL